MIMIKNVYFCVAKAKVDAVMALYNLSTLPEDINTILAAKPIPPLVNLLKICKKSSKIAEKCTALVELLLGHDEGRMALTSEEGGVLLVVEVLEEGSPLSREHAIGALLTMCESDHCRYREVILNEGVMPGLKGPVCGPARPDLLPEGNDPRRRRGTGRIEKAQGEVVVERHILRRFFDRRLVDRAEEECPAQCRTPVCASLLVEGHRRVGRHFGQIGEEGLLPPGILEWQGQAGGCGERRRVWPRRQDRRLCRNGAARCHHAG